ncbi:Polyamine aminopropyltransferase [subsurface metagenome]
MQRVKWAIFFSGLAAVIAQTLVIREGLALFGGYELVSGILLCFWLVWGGLGSFIFTKLKLKSNPEKTYALLLLILGFFAVISITFIRFALKIFSLPFGEVISLDRIILISAISLAPVCLVFGALFPAASKILAPEKVYLLEGIGAFLGGIIISFILIQILPPYGILLIVVFFLTVCAFIMIKKPGLLVFSFILLLLFTKVNDVEQYSRKTQMGGQNLVALRESKYGMIAITKYHTQLNFYINGVYDFSCPDIYTSEEAVHYPLLLHEMPRKVLLVGGGIGNCITQISKHPDIKEITYLELDPLLFKMGEEYIGENLKNYRNLNVIFGDARFFIKNTKEKYDVIIINLPDPVNAQLNRFYTQEFFAEAKRIMNTRGIVSVRITAPPDIISPLFGQLLNTMRKSLHSSFEHILILPAAKTTYIATDHLIEIENVADILKSRIRERNLDLTYVNEYFFDYNFTPEKMNYLKNRVEESEGVLNADLKPVCYYFTTILWGGVISGSVRNLFIDLFNLSPWLFLVPLVFVFLFFKRRSIIYLSVFSIGASEISAEVILIILFQISYGYLYGWIGAIIAFYMLGLALGTLFYMRSYWFRKSTTKLLSNVEFIMGLYFAIIILILFLKLPSANIIIPILIFFGGFMGGLHFPLSVGVLKRKKAGIVYGVDLIGSSIGALITSIIFIPILGIIFTLFIFVVLNVLVAIGLRTI